MKSLQQRCVSSEFICSFKQVIVLPTNRSILFSLQRDILKKNNWIKLACNSQTLFVSSIFWNTQQCWLAAVPIIFPDHICFAVVRRVMHPSAHRILSSSASPKASLALMRLRLGANCVLMFSSKILVDVSLNLVISMS